MQAGDAYSSWAPGLTLILGVRFFSYGGVPTQEDITMTPDSSPEMTKKSWFGSLMGFDREEHHLILAQDKPLSQVKADLVHALLSTADLSHSVVSTTFRAEYRRSRRSGTSSILSRNVRFQVDISPAHANMGPDCTMFCLTFTLISVEIRSAFGGGSNSAAVAVTNTVNPTTIPPPLVQTTTAGIPTTTTTTDNHITTTKLNVATTEPETTTVVPYTTIPVAATTESVCPSVSVPSSTLPMIFFLIQHPD
ncbi:hypothetical protein FSP39_003401 [Pinctada imbricata]|uniref:Uncharacterized protein n=1 Tax=Pinctada imbricata TaxID=66713 RepID=A0AA89C9T1_PINIB|nr:hypothetical protein FSP39_003401 [Pinctada imbricata]